MSMGRQKAGSGAPTTAVLEGALYQREDAPNGDIYVVRNGVWTSVFTGGSVTLAGDVTGASGANTVVAMHGTAGIVAMHGSQIAWDAANTDWGLTQTSPTSNVPAGNLLVQLATPFASATGFNRNAPTGTFAIPAPTSGGTEGRWAFDVSGTEQVAIETGRVLVTPPVVQFPTTATFRIGASARALAFLDNSPTPVARFFTNTIEWANTVTTPVLGIQQPTSDVATVALVIQGQAAFGGATLHPQSGDIHYICMPDGGDPPNPGNHVWYVNAAEAMRLGRDSLQLRRSLEFTSDLSGIFNIKPADFAGAPHGVRIDGGSSSAISDHDGGAVAIAGGIGSGAGLTGIVMLVDRNGQGQVSVTDAGDTSHQCVVLCSSVVQGNLPTGVTNFIYVGDATGPTPGNPTAGHVYMSKSGRPYWQTVDGNSLSYNGANVGSTFASPPGVGSFFGWTRFDVNGSACMMPVWLFA